MRLYRDTRGLFHGTQADAGKGFARCDVPDDKAGRIAFLNGLLNEPNIEPEEGGGKITVHAGRHPSEVVDDDPIWRRTKTVPFPRDMSASANLARMEAVGQGIDIDAMLEAIDKAEPYTFRRIAGAVAFRIAEGSK